METLKRVDPFDCRCQECLNGTAKPLNFCTQEELKKLYRGNVENRSGRSVKVRYITVYEIH